MAGSGKDTRGGTVRHAAKVDVNHGEIRDGLRAVFGDDAVKDVSMYPRLGFDLIAYVRGRVYFLEVKQPRKATQLTEAEDDARKRFPGVWHVVTTIEEALELVAPGR